jgi:hypothetical protein
MTHHNIKIFTKKKQKRIVIFVKYKGNASLFTKPDSQSPENPCLQGFSFLLPVFLKFLFCPILIRACFFCQISQHI